jgi:hypothetical protein
MMGKKIARILPETCSALSDSHTARHTSQLQPMARRKICHDVSCRPLDSAIVLSRSKVSAPFDSTSAPARR